MRVVTFCNIFYIAFIAEASGGKVSRRPGSLNMEISIGKFADMSQSIIGASQKPGPTYCVNFQVGVPGSLSTIFSF